MSESNQASFSSLQEVDVGSQAVLQNAESYGLYAARVLEQQMGTGQTLNITGENMGKHVSISCTVFFDSCLLLSALRAQSIAVDNNESYAFPSMREVADLSLPNGSLASISIPSSLLEERASGKVYGNTHRSHNVNRNTTGRMSVLVASVLFTTIQAFLPTSSSRFGTKHNGSMYQALCNMHK